MPPSGFGRHAVEPVRGPRRAVHDHLAGCERAQVRFKDRHRRGEWIVKDHLEAITEPRLRHVRHWT